MLECSRKTTAGPTPLFLLHYLHHSSIDRSSPPSTERRYLPHSPLQHHHHHRSGRGVRYIPIFYKFLSLFIDTFTFPRIDCNLLPSLPTICKHSLFPDSPSILHLLCTSPASDYASTPATHSLVINFAIDFDVVFHCVLFFFAFNVFYLSPHPLTIALTLSLSLSPLSFLGMSVVLCHLCCRVVLLLLLLWAAFQLPFGWQNYANYQCTLYPASSSQCLRVSGRAHALLESGT